MKINPRKNQDLDQKSDYPTAGWLNQNHDLLQGMGLKKTNPAERRGDYATDHIFSPIQINSILDAGRWADRHADRRRPYAAMRGPPGSSLTEFIRIRAIRGSHAIGFLCFLCYLL